jgi:molybdate transport system regulatory protein
MAKIENDVYVDDKYLSLNGGNVICPMLRLTLKKEEKFFGPGVATLLHLIEKEGSIQSACATMEMSYSKAWKILKRAEKELGFPLLISRNGGAKGGQSMLTEAAEDFLKRYDRVSLALKKQAQVLFEREFAGFSPDGKEK